MAFVTRFKRRRYDANLTPNVMTGAIDGPVSGSIMMVPYNFGPGVASKTYSQRFKLSAGMGVYLIAADQPGYNVVGTVNALVGNTDGGVEIVASTAVPASATYSNGGALTLVANSNIQIPTSSTGQVELCVNVTTAAASTFDSVTVTLTLYVATAPTALVERNWQHA